jgi:hypothetical protein
VFVLLGAGGIAGDGERLGTLSLALDGGGGRGCLYTLGPLTSCVYRGWNCLWRRVVLIPGQGAKRMMLGGEGCGVGRLVWMLVMVGALRGQPGRARWVPALGPHWGVLLDSGPFWGEQSRVMFSTVPGGCLQPHHLAEVTLVPGLRLPLPGFQVPVHFYNLITFANSAAATATVRELGKRCHTRHAPL